MGIHDRYRIDDSYFIADSQLAFNKYENILFK